MKNTPSTVALALSAILLLLVILWRTVLFGYFEKRYPAALYFAQIRAVDEMTSRPVDFEIGWDYEAISPFLKGSGPARIKTNPDKTVVVSMVGLPLEGGLPIKISAAGYSPKVITIAGEQSGLQAGSADIEEVRLRPLRSNSPRESAIKESAAAPSDD